MLKTAQRLNQILSVITAAAMTIMMIHVTLHALLRHFLQMPIYGTNEIVAYWYLPIIALLGIPAAQLQKEHISVTLITDRMSTTTAAVFKGLALVLGLLLCLGFAWYGLMEAVSNTVMNSKAGVTDIVTFPVYYLVPLVFVLLALLYLVDLVLLRRAHGASLDLTTGTEADSADSAENAL